MRLTGTFRPSDEHGATIATFNVNAESGPTRPQVLGTALYPLIPRTDDDLLRFDMVEYHPYYPEDRATFPQIARMKARKPSIMALMYYHIQGTWDWQNDWLTVSAREPWFVHAANGRRILAGEGAGWWMNDMGQRDFIDYQNNRVLGLIQTYGFDGLVEDGPFTMLSNDPANWPRYSETIPDAVLWQWPTWAVNQVAATRQALGSRFFITNTTPWVYDPRSNWLDTALLPYVDQTSMEGFAHPYWSSGTDYIGEATWNWQQTQIQRNLDNGKSMWLVSGASRATATQKNQWKAFTFASYLLKANGRSIYTWYELGSEWFPELGINFGMPLGPADQVDGVWRRNFERGRVFVNPADTETRTRDGVTLAPQTGQIAL